MTTIELSKPKTTAQYWDSVTPRGASVRFWSPWDPNFGDYIRLLRRNLPSGSSLLELGCAPGTAMAWAAKRRNAKVTGVDYSDEGCRATYRTFDKVDSDFYLQESDIFTMRLPKASFDCVASFGLIEHFDNAAEAVARHVEMLKPGGRLAIMIPNYGGIWGRIQGRIDPQNLAIHNTAIMNPQSLARLCDGLPLIDVQARYYGRPMAWNLSLGRVINPAIARLLQMGAGTIGSLMPSLRSDYAPSLSLEATRV